jgi:hypothetical protein
MPGIICAAAFRPFFFPRYDGHLLIGLLSAPLPFIGLAIYLLWATKIPKAPSDELNNMRINNLFLGAFALMGVLISVNALISTHQYVGDILSGKTVGEEYALSSYTIYTWLGGCCSGWMVMFVGFSFILQRQKSNVENSL